MKTCNWNRSSYASMNECNVTLFSGETQTFRLLIGPSPNVQEKRAEVIPEYETYVTMVSENSFFVCHFKPDHGCPSTMIPVSQLRIGNLKVSWKSVAVFFGLGIVILFQCFVVYLPSLFLTKLKF